MTGIKVHIQNGDYARAIHLADSVLAGPEAGNAEVWYWKGRAHSFTRDWENSALAFGEAFRIDPSRADDIGEFWSVFYNTANSRFAEGDVEGALEMLDRGREISPERPEFPQMLGDIHLNRGDVPTALDLFAEAFHLGAVMVAGLESEMERESDPARYDFLENEFYRVLAGAVLSSYNSARILENLYFRTEDPLEQSEYAERAMAILGEGLELDPMNPDLLETKAEILLIQGRFDEALQVYDEAEAAIEYSESEGWIAPEEAAEMRGMVMLTRGFAMLEMERFDEALLQLEGSRSILGDSYEVLATMAHANVLLEDYHRSLEVLENAKRIEGLSSAELANLHYMVFVNYSRLERDQDSLEALLQAVQYDPENALYYEYLASTYSRLGRRQLAIQAMERAEQIRSGQL